MIQSEFNILTRDDLEKLKFVLDSNGDIAIRIIGSSGATSFLTLSDTPSSYTGQAGKGVKVNAGEDTLEFYTLESGGDFFADGSVPMTGNIAMGGNNIVNAGSGAFTGSVSVGSLTIGGDSQSGVNSGDQDLSGYQLKSEKNVNSGYAGLDVGGKINPLQLPALAISETFVVASEVAQLALTVQEGDVAVRTDLNESYIALNDTNATMSDWQKLLTPTDAVSSVAGKTGIVTLDSSDVGLGNVENTALSTWAGSTNITTLGTITSGTWNGTTLSIANGGTGSATKNFVDLTTSQSVGGVKTYSNFLITPSSVPTTNYQVSNKKYVDDQIQAIGGSESTQSDITSGEALTILDAIVYHTSNGYVKGDASNSAYINFLGFANSTVADATSVNLNTAGVLGGFTGLTSGDYYLSDAITSAYDLSVASYDSKSFSVSSQDATPLGLSFKDDGTKMYMLGTANDTIYQYTLSTAYDVNTASYDTISFSISGQDSAPGSLYIKPDGTKFYITGNAGNKIYQYSMSTAWDLSTASYDTKTFTQALDGNMNGVFFKEDDGTKAYWIGSGTDKIYELDLSTAWDISTAVYNSVNISVTSQENNPLGLSFKNDGTKAFIVGSTNNTIYQYGLSTAWDISTAVYDTVSFSVLSEASAGRALYFTNTGEKFYIINSTSVYQYSAGTLVPGGGISHTAGTNSVKVGKYFSSTELLINPFG